MELLGFILVFVLPWWAIEHRDLFLKGEMPPEPAAEADWIRSVHVNFADPMEDFQAGRIDKYTCVERMTALKRFVTFDDVLKTHYLGR